MEGWSGHPRLPADSQESTIPRNTTADPDRQTTAQAHDYPASQSLRDSTLETLTQKSQEQGPKDSDDIMNPVNEPNQAQVSSTRSTKPKIERHEAVRRGLSFGPIKRPGSQPASISGILKSKSQSPISRLHQRSLSSSSDGLGRLEKDDFAEDADGEDTIESSDDDTAESSGDETTLSGRVRGRRRGSETGQRKTPRSPLAGPDDKPTVTITGPEGQRQPSAKRFVVHPNTNFDQVASRPASPNMPNTSDSEELDDIRRAQKLNINTSPINSSVPHRVIQTIIRGDFASLQEEAKEESRRLRTYLVATDLSGEAAYALEWTIGTVMRDGDTLLAVYAVNEEVGTGVTGDSLPIGEGANAMQDTTAVMERMTAAHQKGSLMSLPPSLSKASFRSSSRKSSAANSVDSRALSRAEQERAHAIERLSETCLRFLRKTKLQVRIAIEVIHCKSPKYMVTEAIDGLKPTMVIIGSRGRSALKGVLLGSFSNYLVIKSSAPVMVARKKLSGRKTKIVAPNVRLANNLTPSRRLAEAKID